MIGVKSLSQKIPSVMVAGAILNDILIFKGIE